MPAGYPPSARLPLSPSDKHTRHIVSIQNRVLAVFYLQPITLGAWLPRIPEVQAKLDLDPAGLAIGLLGAPIGTLITLLFAGRLVRHFGAPNIIRVLYPLFMAAMFLPFVAWNLPVLFAALFLVGASMSVLELGLNVVADTAEKHHGLTFMSRAHGFWSLGLMSGTAIGSGAAAIAFDPLVAGAIVAVLTLPLALFASRGLPDDPTQAEESVPTAKRFWFPHPVLLGICLFVFGTAMTEGAVADWSAVYLRDVFTASPGIAGLGVTIFSMTVAFTRLTGDMLRTKFGPAKTARALASIGVLGAALVFFSPSTELAILGFALVGIGAAIGFPLAVTAASAAPGGHPASNVAVLSFTALSGFLVGPILIGSLAQNFGMRYGLLVILPMLALSAILAPMLRPGRR